MNGVLEGGEKSENEGRGEQERGDATDRPLEPSHQEEPQGETCTRSVKKEEKGEEGGDERRKGGRGEETRRGGRRGGKDRQEGRDRV